MSATAAFERFLLTEALLSEDKLAEAHAACSAGSPSVLAALSDLGLVAEESLYRALASFCEMEFADLSTATLAPGLAEAMPAKVALHYQAVPISEDAEVLAVALSNPLDSASVDDLRAVLKRRVQPVVATPGGIAEAMRALYGLGAETLEQIAPAGRTSLEIAPAGHSLDDAGVDPSIVKFVNDLLAEAIQADATDVHIEPFETHVRVRFRIDGILHAIPVPAQTKNIHAAVVSRIKVMAHLNIAEKRLPQDGKIQASVSQRNYDLRVSILPTPHGESIDIRILSRASMFLSLEELGFLPDELQRVERAVARPHGILLLTGPTGSGKTTTLYAALNSLNREHRKTITIEDPIEYQLEGITQMQVQPRIGFDFATGLRSMLRHDPDIMMVGEIRDYETAEMAIRASLTGHLVFSTLHTNDAAGAVTRLIDMGVEPFLAASTMIAVIAQRLIRKNCADCSAEMLPSEDILRELGLLAANARFMEGAGCPSCRETGYKGRSAIAEVLEFTPEIRELTVERAPSTAIRDLARKQGMRTLRETGWVRAESGMTSVAEILRVTADTGPVLGSAS